MMEYYRQHEPTRYTNHHHHENNIKIIKYMLISTLILLSIGLLTLSVYYGAILINEKLFPMEKLSDFIEPHYLLADYGLALLVTVIALVACFKENFFFLVISAIGNIVLSISNIFVPSYRLSIILWQIISSLFILAYTLTMYIKMKLEIKRKKKLEALRRMSTTTKSNFESKQQQEDQRSYQSASTICYDKLILTNEWLQNHHHQSNDIPNFFNP